MLGDAILVASSVRSVSGWCREGDFVFTQMGFYNPLLGSDALAIAEEAGRRVGRSLAVHGISRIIYTDIARDGTLAGPDVPAVAGFVRAVGVPVIAAGGVGSEADLVALARTGVEGVIVGRALYENRLDLSVLSQPGAIK